MRIKSKHLELAPLRSFEEIFQERGYSWDKGWDHYGYSDKGWDFYGHVPREGYEVESQSVAHYVDGVKIVPATGRYEVSSLVYHDVFEEAVFEKSYEANVYPDKDQL